MLMATRTADAFYTFPSSAHVARFRHVRLRSEMRPESRTQCAGLVAVAPGFDNMDVSDRLIQDKRLSLLDRHGLRLSDRQQLQPARIHCCRKHVSTQKDGFAPCLGM